MDDVGGRVLLRAVDGRNQVRAADTLDSNLIGQLAERVFGRDVVELHNHVVCGQQPSRVVAHDAHALAVTPAHALHLPQENALPGC